MPKLFPSHDGLLPGVLAAVLFSLISSLAQAQTYVEVQGGGGEYTLHRPNFAEMRFHNVIRQRMDFSCGSAALATLLTYHYDLPVSEEAILSDMYAQGDKEKIRKQGFSLLDMKNYLQSIGLHAEGYQVPLDKLVNVGIPAIVLINRSGYMHFVVVKGVTHERVLIGDPAMGLSVVNRTEFEKMWNKIVFVVLDQKEIARPHFNSRSVWAARHQSDAPISGGSADLSTLTLQASPTPNFY